MNLPNMPVQEVADAPDMHVLMAAGNNRGVRFPLP